MGRRNRRRARWRCCACRSTSSATAATPRPPPPIAACPRPAGYNLQNRYVGSFLLYGSGATWGAPECAGRATRCNALRWADSDTVQSISLPHGVDRIEALGRNAVVVGTAGKDLHFSSRAPRPRGRDPAPLHAARRRAGRDAQPRLLLQARSRRRRASSDCPWSAAGARARSNCARARPRSRSCATTRSCSRSWATSRRARRGERGLDDGCNASCVDWYGNARPLFLRNRVFALLGYEIVEGRLDRNGVTELRRVSFAPR